MKSPSLLLAASRQAFAFAGVTIRFAKQPAILGTVTARCALGLLLVFLAGIRPASADTLQTFTVSTTWLLAGGGFGGTHYPNPYPIDSKSTIVIDTTTGQVVSSRVTAGNLLGLKSQQSGTGYTLITFFGGTTDIAGDSITMTLNLYLPVASLVGYSGGPICDATNPCNAGTAAC
jgi:hypothetical protein